MRSIEMVKAELSTILDGLIGTISFKDGNGQTQTVPAIRATDDNGTQQNVKGLECHISRVPETQIEPIYAEGTKGIYLWMVRLKWWGGIELRDFDTVKAGDVQFWHSALTAAQHRVLNRWKPTPSPPIRIPRVNTLDNIEELRFQLPDRYFVAKEVTP